MSRTTFQVLEKAIIHNDIDTLQTHGLPADYQDFELLIKALRFGRKRIVNLLLDKGCRVSKPGIRNGTTPLHIAVTKLGWSSVALKLLARGARVDICNENGDTPVHVAFLSGAAGSLIDLLLKRYTSKTFVNVLNKDGLGLLHIACARSHSDVVKAFVDIGGSNIFSQVSLQTNSPYAGWSTLHFAVANGRHKITKCLCHYEVEVGVLNGKGSTSLHLAVHRRDVKMIDTLLRCADWNVNHVDSFGVSHFMAACAGSDPDIVRQFLRIATDTSPETLINAISARVNDLDDCPFAGYTPMHFAAEFGRVGTVQLLIDRDAHCTLNTSQKLSPLDLARKRSHESISALLEKHCRECKTCKSFVPEAEESTVFVDVDSNQTEGKSEIFHFGSDVAENQVIDECCMLNIFPVPEHKVGDVNKGDCELCKLQEIFSIDNCKNHGREDDVDENETQKITKNRNVICSFHINFELCKSYLNGQNFQLFITVVACIYIVACIIFISKYKFKCVGNDCPTDQN